MIPREILYVIVYTLLFLFFAAMWLAIFFRRAFSGRKLIYLAVASTGAVAFYLTISLQPTLQNYAASALANAGASLLVTGAVVVLISGVVQEALKLVAVRLNRFIIRDEIDWLPLGLAVGFGFGVWEAFQLVSIPLGSKGIWFPLAIIERFSAIGLHLALGFVIAYGLRKQRPWRYYLVAAIWHGVANFWAFLYQGRLLGIWPTEIGIFVTALVALIYAGWLYRQERTRNYYY